MEQWLRSWTEDRMVAGLNLGLAATLGVAGSGRLQSFSQLCLRSVGSKRTHVWAKVQEELGFAHSLIIDLVMMSTFDLNFAVNYV